MAPTLIALFLYGLLPIFENTVSGLQQVPPAVLDAADGMGMSPRSGCFRVELPLALPLILEGLKVATVINIGTATIGSTVAAKGLGEVIIAGLISDNTAFILQGGLIVGLMAVLIYDAMGQVESADRREELACARLTGGYQGRRDMDDQGDRLGKDDPFDDPRARRGALGRVLRARSSASKSPTASISRRSR